jgi:hypothetical protein
MNVFSTGYIVNPSTNYCRSPLQRLTLDIAAARKAFGKLGPLTPCGNLSKASGHWSVTTGQPRS